MVEISLPLSVGSVSNFVFFLEPRYECMNYRLQKPVSSTNRWPGREIIKGLRRELSIFIQGIEISAVMVIIVAVVHPWPVGKLFFVGAPRPRFGKKICVSVVVCARL